MLKIPKWRGSRHFGKITGQHSRPQFHLPPLGSLTSWRMWRHLVAKVGTSKRGGKQWQTTPKNLPRMQRTRAIPVASLTSGLCPDRPKGWIPIIIIIIIKIAIRRPSLLWDVTQCRWTAYWSFLHLTLADGAERLSCIISNKLPVCAKQHRTRAKA